MNNAMIDNEHYKDLIVDMYESIILQKELGIISPEESHIVNLLAVMSLNAVMRPDLFNKSQYQNVISIINVIANG